MFCVIYSRYKKIPPCIWERIKSLNPVPNYYKFGLDELLDNFGNVKKEGDIAGKQGTGFFLKVNDNIYVITCNHIIEKQNLDINALATDLTGTCSHIKLLIHKRIPEIDLAILKFANKSQEINFPSYDANQITFNLDTLESTFTSKQINILINSLSLSGIGDDRQLIVKNASVNDPEIQLRDFIGHVIPKIPMLTFTCDDTNFSSDGEIEGLSGSVLTIHNKITKKTIPISMITSFGNSRFESIPLNLICGIVDVALRNPNKVLSGFNIPMATITVELDKKINNVSKFVGKQILDSLEIKYKVINCSENKLGNYFCFEKNDVIIKVNNNTFRSDGKIYMESIGYAVNIDTYLMLDTFLSQFQQSLFTNVGSTNFTIVRNVPSGEAHYVVRLQSKPFDELFNMKQFNSHSYVLWNGLVFSELSEELLTDMNHRTGYVLSGKIFEQPKQSTGHSRYVAIIDATDKTKFPKQVYTSTQMTETMVDVSPYVITPIGMQILVLEKTGNHQIRTIDDLCSAIKNGGKKMTFANY